MTVFYPRRQQWTTLTGSQHLREGERSEIQTVNSLLLEPDLLEIEAKYTLHYETLQSTGRDLEGNAPRNTSETRFGSRFLGPQGTSPGSKNGGGTILRRTY